MTYSLIMKGIFDYESQKMCEQVNEVFFKQSKRLLRNDYDRI
jgi:hypothetical protein